MLLGQEKHEVGVIRNGRVRICPCYSPQACGSAGMHPAEWFWLWQFISLKVVSLLLGRQDSIIRSIMTDQKIPQEASQTWALGICHFLSLPSLLPSSALPPPNCKIGNRCVIL